MADLNALIPLRATAPDIGNALAQGIRNGNALANAPYERRLREAQAAKAAAESQAIDQYGMTPYQAAMIGVSRGNLGVAQQNADTTAARAANSAIPDEIKTYEYLQRTMPDQFGAPPPQGSGTDPYSDIPQGDSGRALPGFMDKYLPSNEVEARNAEAKKRGEAAGALAGRQETAQALGPQLSRMIGSMWERAKAFDDSSFENALGPWQGSGGSDALRAAGAFVPQTLGSITNAIEGGKQSTSQVRSTIIGDTEALAAVIKPLIRSPGEGVWTDADQARLVAVVGDLQFAKTKDEFYERLKGVANRVKDAWGVDIQIPEKDLGDAGSATMDIAPAPSAAQPAATTNAPSNINTQELELIRQAREAIAAGADEQAVMQRLMQMGVQP